MTRKYTFEEKTIDGREYVIAERRGRESEPIRVQADWVDSDDMEGEWEELIKTIVQPETIGEIDIADGSGGIERREAVEMLAGATVDGRTIVSSETQADALVEYLATEGIVGLDGTELVLFRDPDEDSLGGPALMNWAALMSAVIESIDDHLERINAAKARFEETLDSLETQRTDSDERLSKTAQRLKNLGSGQGIPDPAELDADERRQFKRLKSHYVYLRNIEKAKSENLFENVNAGTEEMALAIERLEAAREAYEKLHTDTREAALRNTAFPEAAMEFVQNAGNLITDLTGIEADAAEDVDHEDLEEMIADDLGETAQDIGTEANELAETAERSVGENLQL